jgi:hypothetical protein
MQFPVQSGSDTSTTEALNYLLSGPGGLGQNFQGFSSYTPAYLTGNYRPPFTDPTLANVYVAAFALSTSEMLDERTYKFTFAATHTPAPFRLGNGIRISGTSTGWYDGKYNPIGVVESTTTYVVVKLNNGYPVQPTASGGTIEFSIMSDSLSAEDILYNSTDCNGKVTVTGGTDRVFLSAQLNNVITYSGTGTNTLQYQVAVNRYLGFITDDPVNPEFRFNYDATISARTYTKTLTGSGTLDNIETIFSTVIDQPTPAFYWYILEVAYAGTGDLVVTANEFDLRSLSAQVVKP